MKQEHYYRGEDGCTVRSRDRSVIADFEDEGPFVAEVVVRLLNQARADALEDARPDGEARRLLEAALEWVGEEPMREAIKTYIARATPPADARGA